MKHIYLQTQATTQAIHRHGKTETGCKSLNITLGQQAKSLWHNGYSQTPPREVKKAML